MRPHPSVPAASLASAPPVEELDPAEAQADAIDAAVTEAHAPETVEAELSESVSPAALEAASAAVEAPSEAEPAPQPDAAATDAPAEPQPEIVEAKAPEPEPAEPAATPAEAPVAAAQDAAEAIAEAVTEPEPAVAAAAVKAAPRIAHAFSFAPKYIDVEGIGTILFNYVQTESAAVLSHMRALGEVRTPADMIRLNVTEMQRAADASLTCWIAVARRASRSMAAH